MTPTRHVIIDNETLDVTPSAVLLTIGAVAVEISDGKAIVLGRWYRRIKWEDGQLGRTTSTPTEQWWATNPAVRWQAIWDALGGGQRIPLHLAMHSLNAWLQLNPYPIWGNGSDFDNAQLQHAFTQNGLLWPYWRNRCLRSLRGTVLQLYPNTQLPDFPADKIKHHALHDAEHEADVLAVLLQTLSCTSTIDSPVDQETENMWRQFWKPLVTDINGQIDLGQIKRELHDFHQMLNEVPAVYIHVTNGKVSKPLTDADVVIALHDDHVTELINQASKTAAS